VKITVVGGNGYLGRHLVAEFRRRGWSCLAVGRESREHIPNSDLGHVVYCAGVTTDFLRRPADTVTAHVTDLQRMLERAKLQSLLYLSSTRVYLGSARTHETAPVSVQSTSRDYLYNLSKLLGENICQFSSVPTRIVRLSNVYGPDWQGPTFLSDMIRSAVAGQIRLVSNPLSAKDYVSLDDVVAVLPRILNEGVHTIYNVASGHNVSHAQIIERLRGLTGCMLEVDEGAEAKSFSTISTERLRNEFDWRPRSVLADLPRLVDDYRIWLGGKSESLELTAPPRPSARS
jgi:nucleoside-diphosphate-sugar epimerase